MPDLVVGLGLLAVAAVLLVAGAELFVEHLAGAASRLGVSVVAVAVLLAGAEPEEALTSALASAAGRPALAVGDAVGANLTVLGLVLGLAAVVAPLPVGRRVRTYAVMASVAGLCAVLVLLDGQVSRPEGAGLLAAYALLVAVVWWREHGPPAIGELAELAEDGDGGGGDGGGGDGDVGPASQVGAAGALTRALAGLVLMTVGGAAAVGGAERVVAGSGSDDTAVGLTLLALATSAEMLALVVAARRHAVAEVAVAGAVGAVAYNATVTLGIAPLVRPLRVEGFVGPAVLAAVLPLVVVVLSRGGRLGRPAGALLLAVYVAATVVAVRGW